MQWPVWSELDLKTKAFRILGQTAVDTRYWILEHSKIQTKFVLLKGSKELKPILCLLKDYSSNIKLSPIFYPPNLNLIGYAQR